MQFVWKYKLDHVAFWIVTLLFYAFTRKELLQSAGPAWYALDIVVRNALLAAACYCNIYCLFARFFKKGNYWIYGIGVFGLLVVYTILQNGYHAWMTSRNEGSGVNFFYNAYYNFSIGIFYIGFTLALELSKRWYRQQLQLHEMQTEKLATELRYLKAQINPHFLFNSINTIYFQIDKNNLEARETLEKFSELLRYQLYECNEDKIPIEKETSYLQSYVALQKLRKNGNYQIQFNTNENVKGFCIAPLLLLPLVENAFKHLSDFKDQPNSVALNMYRENGSFIFNVSNSVNAVRTDNNHSGIGLKNVQRRLDLLYADHYTMDIDRKNSRFSIKLAIHLS